ncbi:MAG: SURF1 family protein, partial [Hellea sp.]|nr:SURF1 family protein [Hellea sp.]
MPWLTAIVLLFLLILINLGTWQYERLKWKTNLLAE